ncbi:hypothetical protein HispidOSU_007892 [Sigmodon hispidus]
MSTSQRGRPAKSKVAQVEDNTERETNRRDAERRCCVDVDASVPPADKVRGRAEPIAGVWAERDPVLSHASRSSLSPQQPFSNLHPKFRKCAESLVSPVVS